MLSDLGLSYDNIALFVGEVVNSDSGGACTAHNEVISHIPKVYF